MFGSIGLPELILIFVVVLLLFGPDKLPHVAKTMGKTIREFRATIEEAKSAIGEEIEKSTGGGELKEIERDLRASLRPLQEPFDVYPPPAAPPAPDAAPVPAEAAVPTPPAPPAAPAPETENTHHETPPCE